MNSTFSTRIANALNETDKSNYELGKLFNVNRTTIATYKAGKGDLKGVVLVGLCEHFNYNPDYLLTGKGEKFLRSEQIDEDTKNFIAAVEYSYQRINYSSLEELAYFANVSQKVITDIFEKKIIPHDMESRSNIAAAFKYDLPTFLKIGKQALTPADNTYNEQVGRNLRKIREFMKLTLDEFGEKLGMPGSTLLMLENGELNFRDGLVKDLAKRCFAHPEYLKTGQGEMFTKNPLFFLDEDIEFVYKLREELAWDLDEELEKDLINLIRNRYKKLKVELKEKFDEEKEKLEKELKTETTGFIKVMKGGQW